MTTFKTLLITAATALAMTACGSPAPNAPANSNASNSNANASKPVAAAPSKDELFAMDKKANEAYVHGDGKFFDDMLSDKFVMYGGGHRMTKADAVKMIGGVKCEMKDWSLDDAQMAMIDADTYVISYKANFDGTCSGGPDGKQMKVPSPIRSASVWVRNGAKWQPVFHGENPIVDPKNPPPAAPKSEPKKAEPKKDDAKKDSNSANSNTAAAPAAPAADPNTAALTALHTSGWEAWKAKDAKKLQDLTSSNLSWVDPAGNWFGTKADVIKGWTENKCEGITKVGFKDGFASAVSPTVEILTGVGNADGTCDGHKNGDLDNVAVYVKEGSDWKLAFFFESMPM